MADMIKIAARLTKVAEQMANTGGCEKVAAELVATAAAIIDTPKKAGGMTVYVIEQYANRYGDSETWFRTEVYDDKELAKARMAELELALGQYSDFEYVMEEVTLNQDMQ